MASQVLRAFASPCKIPSAENIRHSRHFNLCLGRNIVPVDIVFCQSLEVLSLVQRAKVYSLSPCLFLYVNCEYMNGMPTGLVKRLFVF